MQTWISRDQAFVFPLRVLQVRLKRKVCGVEAVRGVVNSRADVPFHQPEPDHKLRNISSIFRSGLFLQLRQIV